MNCKNKSFMTKKKAFTFVELLVVIAIIGILFVVLVSRVNFATDKAKANGTIKLNGITAIYVPADSVELYKNAQYWSAFADIIQLIQ